MYTQPALENNLGSFVQEQFKNESKQERNKHELQVLNNLDPETVKDWLRRKLGDLTQSVDIKPFENGQAFGLDPKRSFRYKTLEDRTVDVVISGSDDDSRRATNKTISLFMMSSLDIMLQFVGCLRADCSEALRNFMYIV
jgi:hypothetical protein